MKRRWVYLLLLGLMLGGVLTSLGTSDSDVDLSAPLAVFGRLVRDVDQVGLRVTRVSDAEETALGRRVADGVYPVYTRDDDLTTYVSAVGAALTPHVERPAVGYTVAVIDTPDVNAFALPGGFVFVTTGLIDFVESEAELAHILGHEIAHVDLRHCIERYQYRMKLKQVGIDSLPAGVLFEIGRFLVTTAYSREQELEADAQGLRMLAQAGYDPTVGAAVFERLAARDGDTPDARARTPVGEVARATGGALGAYLSSHPPTLERAERMSGFAARNRGRLTGRRFYVGRQNLERRLPRSQREFRDEWRQGWP